MTVPSWLADPQDTKRTRFWSRVALKGIALYVLVNVVFALLNPMPALSRLSLYNRVVPGLERFPANMYQLPVMFDAHVIACAQRMNCDYIISGDKDLLTFSGSSVIIITSKEYLSMQ